jgi:hypothetical protein
MARDVPIFDRCSAGRTGGDTLDKMFDQPAEGPEVEFRHDPDIARLKRIHQKIKDESDE